MKYLISPFIQISDINGKPIAGAKIYVYKAETSITVTTYQNIDGGLNTVPILTDTLGNATVLVDDDCGLCDVSIYDNEDNLLFSKKHVSPGSGSTSSSYVYAGYGVIVDETAPGTFRVSIDTDLIATKEDLNYKQDNLIAGDNIEITNQNIINVTGRKNIGTISPLYTVEENNAIYFGIDMDSMSGKLDTSSFNTYSGAVDVAIQGKQDALVFGYNTSGQIDSINYSALASDNGVVFPITGTDGNYDYSANMTCSSIALNSTYGNGKILRINNDSVGLSRYMLGTTSATWADILTYSRMPTISSVALTTSTTAYYWNSNNLSGLNEVHITTPYYYGGPSTYYVSFADEGFNIASGCKVDFIKQNVEGTNRWCVANSSTYEV